MVCTRCIPDRSLSFRAYTDTTRRRVLAKRHEKYQATLESLPKGSKPGEPASVAEIEAIKQRYASLWIAGRLWNVTPEWREQGAWVSYAQRLLKELISQGMGTLEAAHLNSYIEALLQWVRCYGVTDRQLLIRTEGYRPSALFLIFPSRDRTSTYSLDPHHPRAQPLLIPSRAKRSLLLKALLLPVPRRMPHL